MAYLENKTQQGQQGQQGMRGGDVAVGVVIGAALGAIMMRR